MTHIQETSHWLWTSWSWTLPFRLLAEATFNVNLELLLHSLSWLICSSMTTYTHLLSNFSNPLTCPSICLLSIASGHMHWSAYILSACRGMKGCSMDMPFCIFNGFFHLPLAASFHAELSYPQLMFSFFLLLILFSVQPQLSWAASTCPKSFPFLLFLSLFNPQPISRFRAVFKCAWFGVIMQPVPPLGGPLAHSLIPL